MEYENGHIREDILLDLLNAQAIENTLEKYELKKLPENPTLNESLECYTKEKLLRLASANGIEVRKSWNKSRLIESISTGIWATIEERFLILGQQSLELMKNYIEKELTSKENSKKETIFYTTIYPIAVKMGFLFPYKNGDETLTIMPEEIKKALDHALEDFEKMEQNYQDKMVLWEQFAEALTAGIHLYGVITIKRVMDLWKICHTNSGRLDEESLDIFDELLKILPILVINNHYLYTDTHIIASIDFDNEEDVNDFYNYQTEKMGHDFYEPSKEDIQYFAEHSFDRRTLEYKRVKQLISKVSDHPELVMNLIEENIILDLKLSDLLDYLLKDDLVRFGNDKQFDKFVELYTELQNNTRLWENEGYTPTEMVVKTMGSDVLEELKKPDFEEVQQPDNIIPMASYREEKTEEPQTARPKKIGRNDPCPCGSGKKYKKCCLRKNK